MERGVVDLWMLDLQRVLEESFAKRSGLSREAKN